MNIEENKRVKTSEDDEDGADETYNSWSGIEA
jgi:hypothetical protein